MEEFKFNSENDFTDKQEETAAGSAAEYAYTASEDEIADTADDADEIATANENASEPAAAESSTAESEPAAAPVGGASRAAKRPKSHAGRKFFTAVLMLALCFGSGALGARLFGGQGQTVIEKSYTSTQAMPTQSVIVQTTGDTKSYIEGASMAKPTVVEITTEQVSNNTFFSQYITSGAGSGVIISADGYIITNQHVINGASKITVRLSGGTTYEATVVGADTQGDVAVIKIDAEGLPAATIGNSANLVVGQEVVAIGNPLGELGGTVTNGIISALGREVHVDGQRMTLLQTNAAINPGNSGGGLFNMQGELVALVNAKSAGTSIEGLGFAIPINEAYAIATELMKNGYVSGRPAIGISYIEISNYMDLMRYGVNAYGIYIYDGGQTELKNGDRIVKFGDYEVQDAATLRAAIQSYKVGDVVEATVVRSGKYTTVAVTLVENKPTENSISLQTQKD